MAMGDGALVWGFGWQEHAPRAAVKLPTVLQIAAFGMPLPGCDSLGTRCHHPVRQAWSQRREMRRRFGMPSRSAFDPETLSHGPCAGRGLGRVREPSWVRAEPEKSGIRRALALRIMGAVRVGQRNPERLRDVALHVVEGCGITRAVVRPHSLAAVKPTEPRRGRGTNGLLERRHRDKRCAHATSLPDRLSAYLCSLAVVGLRGRHARHVQRG